jgi:hypothetical protein
MESVTADAIRELLRCLGERWRRHAVLYLLGGSALCLLGSPRETRDLDYTAEVAPKMSAIFGRSWPIWALRSGLMLKKWRLPISSRYLLRLTSAGDSSVGLASSMSICSISTPSR